MSNKTITLTKVFNPLNRADQDTIQWQMVQGQTLANLLDNAGCIVGGRDSVRFAVSVNGQQIPAEQWAETSLVAGQQITVVPVLTGGGGGGKDVLRMVGMVIIAIVATVVSYGILTSPAIAAMIGGTALTATTAASMGMVVAAAIGSAAVMVAGSLLLNAVLPPSRQQIPTANGYASIDQSNAYSWNPQNTQQQGIAIPWHYGNCKLHGNIIGVFRESIGRDVYINALISIGSGVLSGLSDFKINGQPYGNYRGIEMHTRLGHLVQETIPNFGDTKVEYPLGTKVVYGTPVTYSTIGSSFDGMEVEVSFPSGLYYYDDYGKLQNFSVDFSVEIKKQGDVAWSVLTQSVYQYYVSAGGYWSAGYWEEQYTQNTDNPQYIGTAWVELANGGTDPNAYYIGQYYNKYATWQWFGSERNIASGIHDYVTATTASTGAVTYTYKAWGLDAGTYDVRVTRLTADQTDTRYGDDFYITAVREVVQDDLTYPGQALIGLRALATDQLSGSFSFECRTTGKLCRVYNGSTWSVAATSNPAWICFDILTQPVFDASLNVLEYAAHDPANLDIGRWYEWAQYCDDLVPDGNGGIEHRLCFNGSFDSAQSMWDAALAVAKIGRATPYWRGTTITVAIDKPSEPVALISVGNIGLDSFEETFLSMENRAGSIEADFLNLEKDLDRDKFTIINPDAPAEWGSASLPLQGVIRPSEVWRHCRYYLATTQNLTRVVTVQMDTDSIAFTIGDVVHIQHDVPMWGEGGRIVSATSSSVVLDKEVTIAEGTQYSIMLRLLDGTVVERTVSNPAGTTDTITISTPFATTPDSFDVYAFGEVDRSIKPMRVISIDPAGDLKRKITLTDYNETVYNADLLQPVLPTVNYTAIYQLPVVSGLKLSERLEIGVTGAVVPVIDASWYRVDAELARNIEVLINGALYDRYDAGINTASIAVATGINTVAVRTIGYLGEVQPMAQAASATINVLGLSAPPPDLTGFRINCIGTEAHLSWTPVVDIGLSHYTIKYSPLTVGASWSSSVSLVPVVSGNSVTVPAMVGTYLIKAVRYGGSESTTASMVTSAIAGIAGLNAVELVEPAPLWTGTLDNVEVCCGVLRISSAESMSGWTSLTSVLSLAFGLTGYESAGSYESDTITDLGQVYTSRLTAQLLATTTNALNVMAGWSSLSQVVALSGADPGEWDMSLQVSYTSDDPALNNWSEWQEFVVGDYSARAFKFRLLLYAYRPYLLIQVAQLSINIDMPDRIISMQDVTCPAAGMRVDFMPAFRAMKALAVDGQDMVTGDYKTITNKDETGFDLRFFSSAGTGVERTFDAIATGYGQEV